LGVVLVASGIVTVQKGDPLVWPIAAAVAGIGLGLLIWFPRWWSARRVEREAAEGKLAARDRSGDLAPDTIG
jgi:hypothetical protein